MNYLYRHKKKTFKRLLHTSMKNYLCMTAHICLYVLCDIHGMYEFVYVSMYICVCICVYVCNYACLYACV